MIQQYDRVFGHLGSRKACNDVGIVVQDCQGQFSDEKAVYEIFANFEFYWLGIPCIPRLMGLGFTGNQDPQRIIHDYQNFSTRYVSCSEFDSESNGATLVEI